LEVLTVSKTKKDETKKTNPAADAALVATIAANEPQSDVPNIADIVNGAKTLPTSDEAATLESVSINLKGSESNVPIEEHLGTFGTGTETPADADGKSAESPSVKPPTNESTDPMSDKSGDSEGGKSNGDDAEGSTGKGSKKDDDEPPLKLSEMEKKLLGDTVVKVRKIKTSRDEEKLVIGELLIGAKKIFGKHGDWKPWLEGECEIPLTTARRYMRLSKGVSDMPSLKKFALSKVDVLLRLKSNNARNEFIAKNDINALSTSELDELVKVYNNGGETTTEDSVPTEKLVKKYGTLKTSILDVFKQLTAGKEDFEATKAHAELKRILDEAIAKFLPTEKENA
jgi:hypothetical protein